MTEERERGLIWRGIIITLAMLTLLALSFAGVKQRVKSAEEDVAQTTQIMSVDGSMTKMLAEKLSGKLSGAVNDMTSKIPKSSFGSLPFVGGVISDISDMISDVKDKMDSAAQSLNSISSLADKLTRVAFVYKLAAAVCLIMLIASVLLMSLGRKAGIAVGWIAAALSLALGITAIIAIYKMDGVISADIAGFMEKLQNTDEAGMTASVSLTPSLWTWILPITSLIYGAALFFGRKSIAE